MASFCEIGVEAAREIADIPSLGLEEPTLTTSPLMGEKFAEMTEQCPRVAMNKRHIRRYGLLQQMASIRPLELSVAEVTADPEDSMAAGIKLAQPMIEEDGADKEFK